MENDEEFKAYSDFDDLKPKDDFKKR